MLTAVNCRDVPMGHENTGNSFLGKRWRIEYMDTEISQLLKKGVKIPNPYTVDIGDDVDTDRISEGVTIYSGCKIYGKSTLILRGAEIGYEAPVTIENCHIGPDAALKGGFFKQAVFLKKSSMGLGARVREGTILEEEASCAHTVGLKQTILFPFVTLGSLINFCDILMSGGTSRRNHSEVGSSYIHFNYTPNQDKATPSLLGDVSSGAMLNQPPIFLGGQGGLVGPCRLAFGTVTAAGTICRTDELQPGHLISEVGIKANIPFKAGRYQNSKRIIANNMVYIANLFALNAWYIHVRSQFVSEDFPQLLLDGLKEKLAMGIEERIIRLKDYCQNVGNTDIWQPSAEKIACLRDFQGDTASRDRFLEKIHRNIAERGKNYPDVIAKLAPEDSVIGMQWLRGIAESV